MTLVPHLELRALTVAFGGLVAVDGLDLAVELGSISAVIGPNGAGKTTTFNTIMGVQNPTSGDVLLSGESIRHCDPIERSRLGLARTFQNISLVPELTVEENVIVGASRFRQTGIVGALLRTPAVRREEQQIRDVAAQAMAFVGLKGVANNPSTSLSYGDRRRLEIARALSAAPDLLLLDEPSAGMDASETRDLADIVRAARDAFALTVLVIEHDMDFIRHIASHTTVLDFGRVIADGATEDVLDDPNVRRAYLGEEVSEDGEDVHA